MTDNTQIEWSDATWNPITGCDKVGPGCDHCYAEVIAEQRLKGTKAFPNGFKLTARPHLLDQPIRWKRPRNIFVNSMSDLFHKDVVNPKAGGPIYPGFLSQIFGVMEEADHHTYQILTKRSSLMRDWINDRYKGDVPPHIWLGVSIEDRAHLSRLEHLRDTETKGVRFISFEPLLGPIGRLNAHDVSEGINLSGIHWVIVGGESGRGARPIEIDIYDNNGLPFSSWWVREIQHACRENYAAFFFKQWGGVNKKKNGRLFEGKLWNQFPEIAEDGRPVHWRGW